MSDTGNSGNELLDGVFGMIRGDSQMLYHASAQDNVLKEHVITPGVAKKMVAVLEEMERQGGRIEAYCLPLRRPHEYITRDCWFPTHATVQGAYVKVDAEGFLEYSQSNTKGLVPHGWMHFHPRYPTLWPSSTDRGNNENVVLQLLHNKIDAQQEMLLSNLQFDVKEGKLHLISQLSGDEVGIPMTQLDNLLQEFGSQFGITQSAKAAIDKFLVNYFSTGKGITQMSRYQKKEIIYGTSTIWNGSGLESILKLDGTPDKGRNTNYIYSEVFGNIYLDGQIFAAMGPKEISIRVQPVSDDITFDRKYIHDMVKARIIDPTRPKLFMGYAKPAATADLKGDAAAQNATPGAPLQNGTAPAAPGSGPVIVDQMPHYDLRQWLIELINRAFGYNPIQQPAQKTQPADSAVQDSRAIQKEQDYGPDANSETTPHIVSDRMWDEKKSDDSEVKKYD